jgi:hypothetical protein
MIRRIVTAVFLSVGFVSAFAGTAKVERIDRPADSPVSAAIWDVLDAKGYRLTSDDGTAMADVWLRKNVPNSGAKEVEGVLFPEIPPSTLLGIISFPKAAADFRGQQIKPGFYNLRYELIPNDGNHLGVSPSRDFVLLTATASDSDPAAQFKFDELVALSRKATATTHPGPLSLVQANSAMPGLVHDDQDHWVFSFRLPLGSEEIPMGLIVKGTAQQ